MQLLSGLLVHGDEESDEEAYCTGEEPENQSVEEHKSVILHLLSQLKLGMDLTKVSWRDVTRSFLFLSQVNVVIVFQN